MIVRIRLGQGPMVQHKHHKNRHVALAIAALLTPSAVMACVLALWRITADFNLTAGFPIGEGFFSHWQVWFGTAAIIQFCATALNRYGKAQARVEQSR